MLLFSLALCFTHKTKLLLYPFCFTDNFKLHIKQKALNSPSVLLGKMKIEHHIRKARKFESTIGKLDFHEDYETIIEDYMLAASHLINAALHKLGKLKIEKDVKHNQLFGFLTNEHIPE